MSHKHLWLFCTPTPRRCRMCRGEDRQGQPSSGVCSPWRGSHWSPCGISRHCLKSRTIFFFIQAVCHYLSPRADVAVDGAAQCPNCVIKEEIVLLCFLDFPCFSPRALIDMNVNTAPFAVPRSLLLLHCNNQVQNRDCGYNCTTPPRSSSSVPVA